MKFRPVVKEDMWFKDSSYLELWQPFCAVELNNLCNFGRQYYEAQLCEIIFNLDQWIRTICASLVKGIKRNNSVKLF